MQFTNDEKSKVISSLIDKNDKLEKELNEMVNYLLIQKNRESLKFSKNGDLLL